MFRILSAARMFLFGKRNPIATYEKTHTRKNVWLRGWMQGRGDIRWKHRQTSRSRKIKKPCLSLPPLAGDPVDGSFYFQSGGASSTAFWKNTLGRRHFQTVGNQPVVAHKVLLILPSSVGAKRSSCMDLALLLLPKLCVLERRTVFC